MSLLEELARRAAMESREPHKPLDPAVAEMRLREAMARFTRPNPFKVGDWVTPVKDGVYSEAGEPHVVVATRDAGWDFDHAVDQDSAWFGIKHDVRLIKIKGDVIAAAWFESSYLEPYATSPGN